MKKWLVCALALVLVLCCSCNKRPMYSGSAQELDQILQEITTIPVGTMGSSAIIVARATELLGWCESTAMSSEELASTVKAYCDTMPTSAQEMFCEQVYVVVNSVGALSRDNSRVNTLSAAGLDASQTWSTRAYALASSIDDQL